MSRFLSESRSFGSRWTLAPLAGASFLLLASLGCSSGPKTAATPAPVAAPAPAAIVAVALPSSTAQGVYTLEQASQGKDVFAGTCMSCHATSDQIGGTFNNLWRNRPLSELYKYVSEKMPKNDPGSLAPKDYAAVVAYLLQLNKMPAGDVELPPDVEALSHVRVGN